MGGGWRSPTFREEDYELVDFPEPIGRMEAFVAGGGTSTMPWTFEGKLRTLWNKTLRWPGHFVQWKAYMDAGLLETDPVEVGGSRVVPRDVLHALIDPAPGHARRAGPGHRPGPGEGPTRRRPGHGRRRADRPLRPGDRVHGHGAHHRLGRLDQGDPQRPGGHAPGRSPRPRSRSLRRATSPSSAGAVSACPRRSRPTVSSCRAALDRRWLVPGGQGDGFGRRHRR